MFTVPDSEWTIGEIVRSLQRIEDKQDSLYDDLKNNFVSRDAWVLKNAQVDLELKRLNAAKAPWWVWVTAFGVVANIIFTVVQNW